MRLGGEVESVRDHGEPVPKHVRAYLADLGEVQHGAIIGMTELDHGAVTFGHRSPGFGGNNMTSAHANGGVT